MSERPKEPPIFCFFFSKKEKGTQILLYLTSGIKEVFGVKRRKFGKIASRAIFLLSLVIWGWTERSGVKAQRPL